MFGFSARTHVSNENCSSPKPLLSLPCRSESVRCAAAVRHSRRNVPKGSRLHVRRCDRQTSVLCESSSDRNASQEILQIVIAPADAAAEREGGVVEDVVDSAADEKQRGVRFLR